MSQRKRPSMQASSIPESVEDGGHMDSSDNVAEVSSDTGIDSLPDEMLVNVFSYLGHCDVLSSRLVNKRWCRVMTSWPEFKNSVVYLLKEGTNSIETLSKSDFCWSNVRFNKFRLDVNTPDDFCVLDGIAKNVASVEFNYCLFTWATLKPIITMFSNLEALDLTFSSWETEKDQSSQETLVTRDHVLVHEKWSTLMNKLRKLRVIHPSFLHIARILPQFKGLNNLLALDVLQLFIFNFDFDEELEQDTCEAVVEDLYQIISASKQTLKTLNIAITPGDFEKRLLPNLIERIFLHKLNLEKFDIRHAHESLHQYDEDHVQILQRFMRSQTQLKHAILPKFHGYPLTKEELRVLVTRNLPRTLQMLDVLDKNYLDQNSLDMFPDLRNLDIEGEIHPYVKTGKKYPNMRNLRYVIEATSVFGWVTAFPNLTELWLDRCDTEEEMKIFNDQALQAIIKHLKMLRSLILQIGDCGNISDFGVTGIRKEYRKHLFETRSLNVDDSHEVPAQFITGLPLCSLTGLNRLWIDCDLDISDVGIFFGFRFKELRSLQISVNRQPNPRAGFAAGVTDWGLDCLGKLNPNLEQICLHVNSKGTVSPAGANRLLTRLRRIKDDKHNLDSDYFKSQLCSPVLEDDDDEGDNESE